MNKFLSRFAAEIDTTSIALGLRIFRYDAGSILEIGLTVFHIYILLRRKK